MEEFDREKEKEILRDLELKYMIHRKETNDLFEELKKQRRKFEEEENKKFQKYKNTYWVSYYVDDLTGEKSLDVESFWLIKEVEGDQITCCYFDQNTGEFNDHIIQYIDLIIYKDNFEQITKEEYEKNLDITFNYLKNRLIK